MNPSDGEARAGVLRALERAQTLGGIRRGIYLATAYGASGPVGLSAYRFIHYGEPEGLDDDLRARFAAALGRLTEPERARELLAILER